MKNIITSLLIGTFLTSCTQIQTQIQNNNGKVFYNNKQTLETGKLPPITKVTKKEVPKVIKKKSDQELNFEMEIIKRNVETFLIIQ